MGEEEEQEEQEEEEEEEETKNCFKIYTHRQAGWCSKSAQYL